MMVTSGLAYTRGRPALAAALLSALAWAMVSPDVGICAPGSAPDPIVDVTAQLGAAEVLIGEPFTLFITAVHEQDVDVNLPTALPLGSDLELVGRTSERRPWPDGRLVREFALELIAWELGNRPIPAMPVTYAVAGIVHSAPTQPLEIRVVSVIAPGQDEPEGRMRGHALRDIIDIIGPFVPARRDRTLVYAGAVAGLAILLLLGGLARVYVVRRRRLRRAQTATRTEAGVRLTPANALKDRLRLLEGRLAAGQVAHKHAFIELSAAMRGYVGELFHVPARDWTTAELLAYAPAVLAPLQHLGPERVAEVSARLSAWLGRCDLVKYAGASPSAQEVSAHLAEAYQLADALAGAEQGHA